MKKKTEAQPEETKVDVKAESVWTSASAQLDKLAELASTPKKVTVELELAELYAVITGVYSVYSSLDKTEVKAWKGRAQAYRTLAMKLDDLYEKHNNVTVYTSVLRYAK